MSGFFRFATPSAFFPRETRSGLGLATREGRTAPAYDEWSPDVTVIRSQTNPHKREFVGDVLGILQFSSAPAEPDVWIRFDRGKWIRVKPAFVWEQPFKLVELYVGTAVVGGKLNIVLQQSGRLEAV